MSNNPEIILNINDVARMDGFFTLSDDAVITLTASIQIWSDGTWANIKSFGPYTQPGTIGDNNFSSFALIEHQVTQAGIYRWKAQLDITLNSNTTTELSYTYFQVVVNTLQSPLLTITENDSGDHIVVTITDSYEYAINNIYIRKYSEAYPSSPNLVLTGNASGRISLGIGSYYAKITSTSGSLTASGQTDPVKFSVTRAIPPTPEEMVPPPDYKNIQNVELEAITNTYFGNQFLVYFLKIPQVGYYQDPESKSLRTYYIDRINESVRGVTLPEISTAMVAISYFGHQNDYKMGVGDGELGRVSIRFKLDRYLNNYTAFVNWQYLKYDWTYGGKNPKNNMRTLKDLEGILVVSFLDSAEAITRQIAYKVVVDTVPALTLASDTPDEIEFEVVFRITDMDIEKFVMGHPLSDRQKIL